MGNCRDCLYKIIEENKYGNFFSRGCDKLSDCLVMDGDYVKREFWEPDTPLPDFIEAEEMTI